MDDTCTKMLLEENQYFNSINELVPGDKQTSNKRRKLSESSGDEEQEDKKKKMCCEEENLTISDLQLKLKNKIEKMKGGRGNLMKADENREKILSKRRKDRERYKLKQRMQKIKMKNLESDKNNEYNSTGKKENKTKILNSEGKVVFSKFDFGKTTKTKMPKNWKGDVLTGGRKDLKNLLEKATASKNELHELKKTNPEEAEKLKLKQTWRKAVAKAEGIKIKDNPDLIKKSIQKERAKKKRSTKNWDERNEQVEEKMKKKQDKRKQNLQIRKENKKNKKIKRRMDSYKTPGFN